MLWLPCLYSGCSKVRCHPPTHTTGRRCHHPPLQGMDKRTERAPFATARAPGPPVQRIRTAQQLSYEQTPREPDQRNLRKPSKHARQPSTVVEVGGGEVRLGVREDRLGQNPDGAQGLSHGYVSGRETQGTNTRTPSAHASHPHTRTKSQSRISNACMQTVQSGTPNWPYLAGFEIRLAGCCHTILRNKRLARKARLRIRPALAAR